jgi:hypothetical protein
MNDEEQVPQARTPAAPADAGDTPVEKLEALGVRGILRQLARDGQIIDVRCEMPQCYCFRGRRYFEPSSSGSDWSPTADHYPRLKMHGGHLTPDNVRLAHRLCNRRDYWWREDQRDAREADVAGEDRREAEREEGSNDSRHEQMDSRICSEGIRFLEAPPARRSAGRARGSERVRSATGARRE